MALVMFIFISGAGEFPITAIVWDLGGERGGGSFPLFFPFSFFSTRIAYDSIMRLKACGFEQ